MVREVVIGAAMKSTLTSIQRAREDVEKTSLRLSTGLKVNSALDQPRNFFQASYLQSTANDYSKLLDNMNLGVRTIQNAITGIETVENLLQLAENKALEAKRALEQTSSALPDAILANDPVGYFRLNDADEPNAANLGSLGAGGNGVYTNGVTQGEEILFYGAGGLPARFDGSSGQYIAIPNDDSINTPGPFPERTVELIFNADTTAGRQVLWEEGGTVNSLNIYIDNGMLRVNGRTTNNAGFGSPGYGPLDIAVPIEAGKTYHVAFTQDGPSASNGFNGRFTGYLNGQEFGSEAINSFIGNHPNFNGIGAVNQNVYFHDDGPGNAPGRADGTFAFTGQISDVAIYNSIITAEEMELRYEATSLPISEAFRLDTIEFLDQIAGVVEDTGIRGINLLEKEELVVDFNLDNRNKLEVQGQDFTIEALNLDEIDYQKPSQVEAAIRDIRKAIAKVRDFGFSLANDLSVIQIRQDFTRNTINIAKSGADDLIVADQNKEGANLLAAQTREALATTSLSLASQSQQAILTIFNAQSL